MLYTNYMFDLTTCALSIDPLAAKYSAISPYAFCLNSPIIFNDIDGNDAYVTVQKYPNGGGKIIIASTVYITGNNVTPQTAKTLSEDFKSIVKNGKYTDENGEMYDIEFDVKFVYEPDASKIKLENGDNVLKFVDRSGRSHANSETVMEISGFTKDEDGNVIPLESKNKNYSTATEATIYSVGQKRGTAIHELLHLFGLSDRYEDTKTVIDPNTGIVKKVNIGISVPHKGFQNDIMGSDLNLNLVQTHYNNWAKYILSKNNPNFTLNEYVDVDNKTNNLIGEGEE